MPLRVLLLPTQMTIGWRFDAADGGSPPQDQRGSTLRCWAQLSLEARSSYLVQFVVQPRDFLGTLAIVKQVRSSQTRRLSQDLDLQINQVVNFAFDGERWVSHHRVPPREL